MTTSRRRVLEAFLLSPESYRIIRGGFVRAAFLFFAPTRARLSDEQSPPVRASRRRFSVSIYVSYETFSLPAAPCLCIVRYTLTDRSARHAEAQADAEPDDQNLHVA